LQACIASLLEVALDDVPDFGTQAGQWLRFDRFMERRGIRPMEVTATKTPYSAYYLLSGVSPRGVRHVCIALNGDMVHDPHPSGAGLEIVERHVLFLSFAVF
jgi:hypothetical protein